jgi:membrane-associated phospholipid phosphatase
MRPAVQIIPTTPAIPAWPKGDGWIILHAMLGLFHRLPHSLRKIFSGWNLGWHALAIVLTMIIVTSGLDWSYYLATRGDWFLRLAWPAIMLGGIIPIFGILCLLLMAATAKNRRLLTIGWGLGQAALLGFVISSTCKAFTGRRPPPFSWSSGRLGTYLATPPDTSHGFQFGLLKGGMFWGWPSSHTTVAFSMAACLIALFPRKKPLVILAAFYALYVGLSVSVSIHWLSEFVAGAILGSVIGTVVGRSFSALEQPASAPPAARTK